MNNNDVKETMSRKKGDQLSEMDNRPLTMDRKVIHYVATMFTLLALYVQNRFLICCKLWQSKHCFSILSLEISMLYATVCVKIENKIYFLQQPVAVSMLLSFFLVTTPTPH